MTVQWEGFIEKANKTALLLKALPEGTKDKLHEALTILADASVQGDAKLHKIEELFAGVENAELKAKLHKLAEKSVKFSAWMGERLKAEDEAVRDAARKAAHKLGCKEFLLASDEEKAAKLNELVASLSEGQLAAIKKFREEAKAKDHELDH